MSPLIVWGYLSQESIKLLDNSISVYYSLDSYDIFCLNKKYEVILWEPKTQEDWVQLGTANIVWAGHGGLLQFVPNMVEIPQIPGRVEAKAIYSWVDYDRVVQSPEHGAGVINEILKSSPRKRSTLQKKGRDRETPFEAYYRSRTL